jgi:hypothetical protein
LSSWQLETIGDKLKILPIGINYSNYEKDMPKVYVNFGNFILKKDINITEHEGTIYNDINNSIYTQLKNLCIDNVINNNAFSILATNLQQVRLDNFTAIKEIETKLNNYEQKLELNNSITNLSLANDYKRKALIKTIILLPCSILALVTVFPIYYILKQLLHKKTTGTDHYHSVLLGVIILLIPIILPLIIICYYGILYNWIFALVLTIATFVSIYFAKYLCINWQCYYNFNKITSEQRSTLQRLLKKI